MRAGWLCLAPVLAALAAISVVVAQIVFGRTTSAKPSVALWGSLAIVLTLTGVSLAGDDTTEPRYRRPTSPAR